MNPTIEITDINSKGEGVARWQGKVCFVPQGVPGDLLEVRVVQQKKNYFTARIENIIKPSSARGAPPPCKWFGICGGCSLQHIKYESQLEFKKQRLISLLNKIAHFTTPLSLKVVASPYKWFYRNKAQYNIEFKKGKIKIGFFQPHSHFLTPITKCMLQNTLNNFLLSAFYNIEKVFPQTGFQDNLKFLITKTNFSLSEALAVLVVKKEINLENLWFIKLSKMVPQLKGVIMNFSEGESNVVLGSKSKLLWGKETINEELEELKLYIGGDSFFQVNLAVVKLLWRDIAQEFKGGSFWIDAYCGVGTFSLLIAKRSAKVIAIEENGNAIKLAKASAFVNNINNLEFIQGKVEEVLPKVFKNAIIDGILLDPPRGGCRQEVLSTISRNRPQKVIYISCNPATLARDMSFLLEAGYKVSFVQGYDFFPQTPHLEVAVEFVLND